VPEAERPYYTFESREYQVMVKLDDSEWLPMNEAQEMFEKPLLHVE